MEGLILDLDGASTPQQVWDWLDRRVDYGWVDADGVIHVGEMAHFRRDYRTSGPETVLRTGVGTCIEQVYLLHLALCQLHIPNRMYCCRIYEPDEYGVLEEEEYMHCFLLCQWEGKVLHLEHPHKSRKGIYPFDNEEQAVEVIQAFYVAQRGGKGEPCHGVFHRGGRAHLSRV